MTGLLGNVHCFGMCGGLSSALALSKPKASQTELRGVLLPLLNNLGRLTTYMTLGAMAGGFGKLLNMSVSQYGILSLRGLAGTLLICLGLYLSGWWRGLQFLEAKGAILWRKIAPIINKLMPVQTYTSAYVLGILWGFLPCGLIYSTLSLASTTGSMTQGAIVMGLFGVGTLPSMLTLGIFSERLSVLVKRKKIQQLSGLIVIFLGIWTLIGPYLPYHLFIAHHCH